MDNHRTEWAVLYPDGKNMRATHEDTARWAAARTKGARLLRREVTEWVEVDE